MNRTASPITGHRLSISRGSSLEDWRFPGVDPNRNQPSQAIGKRCSDRPLAPTELRDHLAFALHFGNGFRTSKLTALPWPRLGLFVGVVGARAITTEIRESSVNGSPQMYATLPRKRRRQHHRIDELKAIPLEPIDFCKKWLDFPPEERGFYTRCVRELARVTGLTERAIHGWGPEFRGRPEYILKLLRKEDLLRQIRDLVQGMDELSE